MAYLTVSLVTHTYTRSTSRLVSPALPGQLLALFSPPHAFSELKLTSTTVNLSSHQLQWTLAHINYSEPKLTSAQPHMTWSRKSQPHAPMIFNPPKIIKIINIIGSPVARPVRPSRTIVLVHTVSTRAFADFPFILMSITGTPLHLLLTISLKIPVTQETSFSLYAPLLFFFSPLPISSCGQYFTMCPPPHR